MEENPQETDELLLAFCEESMDLLQELPDKIADFSHNPDDLEPINIVFRSIHTIKGNAGFFGIPPLKNFAHSLEDALDDVRQSEIVLDSELSRCLVEGFDMLGEMIVAVEEGAQEENLNTQQSELLDRVKTLRASSLPGSSEEKIRVEIVKLAEEISAAKLSQSALWSDRLLSLITPPDTPDDQKIADKSTAKSETGPDETASKSKSKTADAKKPEHEDQSVKNRFLRVREERVDGFLEEVSRLFITCERLKDLQVRLGRQAFATDLIDELRQINGTLSGQSTTLQRSVVELRKVPVRGLFSKFPRVARSLASKLGKQLDVHLIGEDIEIDKSLVDELDGPLMHMVRNVCDHGIDMPDERLKRDVPAAGNLFLECSLTKTHVVITVRDDGRGIDPERLRKKAVDKGILNAQEAALLTEQEAVELIFNPGFSTAEQISEISGRGVGLDVVRTRLREHDGEVRVKSQLGVGTTFNLEIPIRTAVVVIDGLLINQSGTMFVIPFERIQEIMQIEPSTLASVHGQHVATVRGEPYAAVKLSKLLELDESAFIEDEPLEAILINVDGEMMILLVDSVEGQRKVVVSDLASVLTCGDGIDGVAQLGEGKLALVLNGHELLKSTARIAVAT